MSNLYSDRYVGKQSQPIKRKKVEFHCGGGMVEFLICLAIGTVVVFTQCLMVNALMKPLTEKYEELLQEQEEHVEACDEILSELYKGEIVYGN